MINDTFLRLKTNLELNPTFSDAISQKHNAVRGLIERAGTGVDTKLIGSLHHLRQTRIQPKDGDQFDIDILVVLGEFGNWVNGGGITAQAAMNQVYSFMQQSDRYGSMTPRQDHPTVTFEYANNVKVELVPAYKDNVGFSPSGTRHQPTGRGYWIPDSSGTRWELADYDYEAQYISDKNREAGGWLIPVVKMIKAIKREHFPSTKSFPLEVIATQVVPATLTLYSQRGITPNYPGLVADFLHSLEDFVSLSIKIPGSNSLPFNIDPIAQLEIMQKIHFLKEKSKNALLVGTDDEKHRLWRQVFGEIFPLS